MQQGRYGMVTANGQSVGQRQEIGAAYKASEKNLSIPEELFPPYASICLSLSALCGNGALRCAR